MDQYKDELQSQLKTKTMSIQDCVFKGKKKTLNKHIN